MENSSAHQTIFNLEVRPIKDEKELENMYYQRWLALRSPLEMPRGTEQDKYDQSAFHLVAVANDRIIGSARLRELSPELGSIAYVAVLSEFCRQGIGTKLVQTLIVKARENNLKRLRVMTRLNALGFYQRLGFLATGATFDYLDIPHQFMELNLLSSLHSQED